MVVDFSVAAFCHVPPETLTFLDLDLINDLCVTLLRHRIMTRASAVLGMRHNVTVRDRDLVTIETTPLR